MADDIFERLKGALADRYRLDRLVGQGGMATVYLALDLKHQRQVAIKVLRPDLSAALGAERFLREIELAAQLQHPHIVPVYDSGSADSVLYYVMPYVEGESLRDLLKREGRIPIDRAAEIVRAAASGLAYAHSQGVVHRDVKPENIMLSGGLAVVTDFGIARAINASRNVDANLTGVGMAMGTPAYMSPEQATADEIDGRTDQYALACVFYEMVSGHQAFSGPTMQAMLTSILTGPRPRLVGVHGITAEIDGATQRALATDPANRFPTIAAFAQAVGLETSGAAAATRESRRWKKLAIGLPVLVAAFAAAYVATFGGPRRTVVSGAETIAVVPFASSGAGVDGLGEGMVDLLAVNLNGVGAIRTIESRAVLREWHRRVKDSGTLEDAIEVARASKAASVLTGSIISTGATTRISADLYDLEGKALAHAQVIGPTESVLVLADSLALGLLHEIWRSRNPIPSANGANITSASMPAIKAYLRGESFHRRSEWDSAAAAFQESVQIDTTFALAWYRLANTLGWKGQYLSPQMRAAAGKAEQFSKNLPARLRSLMVAYHLFAMGDVAATDSAVVYTREYPNDLDGWFLLGESQYHTNGYNPLPPEALRAPFDRVLSIDSTLTPAAIHPVELALSAGDEAMLRRYEGVFRAGGDSVGLRRLEVARDFMHGKTSSIPDGLRLPLIQSAMRWAEAGFLARSTVTHDSIAGMAAALASLEIPAEVKGSFRTVGAQLLTSIGQRESAIEGVKDLQNGEAQNLQPFPVIMAFASKDSLERGDSTLRATLKRYEASTDPGARGNIPYVTFMLALVQLDRGNPAQTSSMMRALLASPTLPPFNGFKGSVMALDGLAIVASGDTLRGMARADSGLRLIGPQSFTPMTTAVQVRYAQLEILRPSTRANGINRLRFGFANEPHLTTINGLRVAHAFELAERFDSAATEYRRFLARVTQPDTAYRVLVEDAKAGLARVTAERATTAPVGGKKP